MRRVGKSRNVFCGQSWRLWPDCPRCPVSDIQPSFPPPNFAAFGAGPPKGRFRSIWFSIVTTKLCFTRSGSFMALRSCRDGSSSHLVLKASEFIFILGGKSVGLKEFPLQGEEVLNDGAEREHGQKIQRADEQHRAEQQNDERAAWRTRSTQKLPSVFVECREMPRTSAAASPMPTAAETKLCSVRPTICAK